MIHTLQIQFSHERLTDWLITALEQSIGYWGRFEITTRAIGESDSAYELAATNRATVTIFELPDENDAELWEEYRQLEIETDTRAALNKYATKYTLDTTDLIKAVETMAGAHPRLFSQHWNDSDADTCDVWIQIACFGEVRYG